MQVSKVMWVNIGNNLTTSLKTLPTVLHILQVFNISQVDKLINHPVYDTLYKL